MRYMHVRWLHDDPEDPIDLFSELDEERWETRKVDVYAGGGMGFADATREEGGSGLSEEAIPDLSEIAADPQFVPREITAEEFEVYWRQAVMRHEGYPEPGH